MVFFFLLAPIKMSLDLPPLKMPRLAPPKSFKYENHIEVLRHLDFFRSWGGPVWDSNVFSKSFTYRPTPCIRYNFIMCHMKFLNDRYIHNNTISHISLTWNSPIIHVCIHIWWTFTLCHTISKIMNHIVRH